MNGGPDAHPASSTAIKGTGYVFSSSCSEIGHSPRSARRRSRSSSTRTQTVSARRRARAISSSSRSRSAASRHRRCSARRRACRSSRTACGSTSRSATWSTGIYSRRSAISSIQLIPGSVPAFGLNTLGGALAIYTKSGAQYPGANVEISGGSFRRFEAQAEAGGSSDKLDWYATGRYLDDGGWARTQLKPYQAVLRQGRVPGRHHRLRRQRDARRQHARRVADAAAVDARQPAPGVHLPRPQPEPARVLRGEREPFPRRRPCCSAATLYYRRYKNTNFSSNVNDDYGDPDDDPPQTNEAFNDRSTIDQQSWGGGLQLTKNAKTGAIAHQIVGGVTGDFGRTRYTQDAQTGQLHLRPRDRRRRDRSSSTPMPTSATTISAPTSPTRSRWIRNGR